MGKIYKQKAEFLLNTIRRGDINELMKREIIKALYESGYTEDEMHFYLRHGDWPATKKEDDFGNTVEDSAGMPPFYKNGRGMKPFKKLAISLIVAFLFMIFGMTMLLLLGQEVNTEDASPSKVVEQTTDGKRAL